MCLSDKETQAVGGHSGDGRDAGVLVRLSLQSQRVRAEVYRSLQHMRAQREQLQSSLRPQREADTKEPEEKEVSFTDFITVTSNTL